jgi:hypothetical protein
VEFWWLSFAVEAGFLGVAIVSADDEMGAIEEATRRGINPGGQVKLTSVPASYLEKVRPYANRLMKREELERIFGEPATPEEYAGVGGYICEAHNPVSAHGES